jgi:hypothetical protein
VNWGAEDFVAAGLIFGAVLAAFWYASRHLARMTYLAAFASGLGAILVIVWVSLAVGIIGEPDNSANLVFAGVLVVAFFGSLLSKLKPSGLSRAMWAAAAAQLVAGITAITVTGLTPDATGVWAVTGFNLALVAAFVVSAWLFGRRDRSQGPKRAFDDASRPY